MKKFMFRYERVLQVRIDKENEIRNNLGKINKLILEKEENLNIVKQQYTDFLNRLNQDFEKGVFAGDMQSVSANKQYLINRIDQFKREIQVLKDERHQIQQELIEANKQRKIMEKLKEKEIEKYKALEALEEAKLVDQIVTYQSKRTKGE